MLDKDILKSNFIKKAIEIHGNSYDYSLVDYRNNGTKVKIFCKEHGVFEQTPKCHTFGQVCPKCSTHFYKKRTTEEFINISKEIHGDKYDYSLVNYTRKSDKVKIICKIHGVFEKIASDHINHKKEGCKICDSGYHFKNSEIFIQDAIKVHGDRYDYSMVEYKGAFKKVKIICKKHGMFEQRAASHLYGSGCIKCSSVYKDTEMFIKESIEVHGHKYDYSISNYTGIRKKVKIICGDHGIFDQMPQNHLKGYGCPKCRTYKGENIISVILDDVCIKYIRQHYFEGCIYKNQLFFDFYLPDYNLCIEYNGEQHYEPIKYFGGEKTFKEVKLRDKNKIEFLKNNNIELLIIKYNEDIKNKLLECLKKF